MPADQPQQLSFEEACRTIFSAWYDGKDLVAGDRAATPKDAAARAVIAALNAAEGQRGTIRILVTNAEQKRLTRNYLDAFLLDQARLKPMVRKMAPELISLHGGISIAVDLNEARLTKSLTTIVLDTSVAEPIASIWLEVDGNTIETKEDAAARRGYKPEDVPNLRFVRWQTQAESAAAAPIQHPLDAHDEPGPPAERRPSLEEQQAEIEARQQAAARQRESEAKYHAAVEARRREETAEKIADHFSRIKQRGV